MIIERSLREFGGLPSGDYEEGRDFIRELVENPRRSSSLRLVGRDGWHTWIGNYRVVYEIDDKRQKVTILHIGRIRNLYQ